MLVPYFHPHPGGVERHVARICRELAPRGYGIDVVTSLHDPSLPVEEEFTGLRVHRFPVSRGTAPGTIQNGLKLTRFRRVLRRADLVHCHDYPTFRWYLLWRLAMPSKPVYITYHGWEGHSPPRPSARFHRRIAERLTRGNICVGAFIEKWYGTKATTITYGAVAPQESGPGEPSDVLLLSRLEPDVPILSYLEGFAELSHLGPSAPVIVVVGGGSLLSEAKERASSLKLPIRFLGHVDDPGPYLRGTRAVVSNGFLAILEAAASEKPVFAIHTSPVMEDRLHLFPHAGDFIHECADSISFASALRAHLSRPAPGDSIPERAVAWARAQTWARLADQYEELWRR